MFTPALLSAGAECCRKKSTNPLVNKLVSLRKPKPAAIALRSLSLPDASFANQLRKINAFEAHSKNIHAPRPKCFRRRLPITRVGLLPAGGTVHFKQFKISLQR